MLNLSFSFRHELQATSMLTWNLPPIFIETGLGVETILKSSSTTLRFFVLGNITSGPGSGKGTPRESSKLCSLASIRKPAIKFLPQPSIDATHFFSCSEEISQ